MKVHLVPLVAVVMALAAAGPQAQLAPGDVAMSGFSNTQFVLVSNGGTVTTVTVTPPFHTSTANSTQSILWDPANPGSFIIGGFGFVGRATVTSATTAAWTPLAIVGAASQMSFDAAGQVVIMDAANSRIRLLNPATGALSYVSAAGQPWGADMNAGIFDPATGDYYVGGNGSVWRFRNGTATVIASALGAFVTAIKLDPYTSDLMVSTALNRRFLRITQGGIVADMAPQASMNIPNGIDVDGNGDFIVSDYPAPNTAPFHLYRVPNLGGPPTLISTTPGPGSGPIGSSGVAMVGGVPSPYRVSKHASIDGSARLSITGIPAGAAEGWTAISGSTALPPGTGPLFGIVADDLTIQLALGSIIAAPGHPIHWLTGIPGVFPSVPFQLPAGTFSALSGLTWDFVSVSLTAGGGVLGPSNVIRVRFP